MFRRIEKYTYQLVNYALVLQGTALLILIGIEVFFRYVVGSALSWPEEVAGIFFVWFTLLGVAAVVREDDHIAFDFLVKHTSPGVGRIIRLFCMLMVLAYTFVLIYHGYSYASAFSFETTPAARINLLWLTLSLPISGLLIGLFSVLKIVGIFKTGGKERIMSMGVLALILFAVFFAFLILGVPIGFALGLAGIIGLIFMDQPFMMFSQTLITGIDNFALLSIPFFVLLGVVMERAEISRSLVDLADELVGFIRGGMAIVTVLASMFFATVSGSGPATVAAIGSITIPDMTARGYSRRFAVGVASSAGASGSDHPPSIPFIIYGVRPENRSPSCSWEGWAPE